MPWWRKRAKSGTKRPSGPRDGLGMRVDESAVVDHFTSFIQARRGVEAYVEPATNVTLTTIILIAHDGEWTRRAVGTPADAFRVAQQLGVPVYDVNQTGYPGRMREWNSRQRGQR